MNNNKEYFLSLLKPPVGLFGRHAVPHDKPEGELRKTLLGLRLEFKEHLIPEDFGTTSGESLDLSEFNTISFSMELTKAGQQLEIEKLDLSHVSSIIVQNMAEYEVWKNVAQKHSIAIIGFRPGLACFINNKLYEGNTAIHPFFTIDKELEIPKDDITDWYGWSEPSEKD